MSGTKIVIIGSGNIAWHFGTALQKTDSEIVHIAGRNEERVAQLARELNCSSYSGIQDVLPKADLYLIAVHDDFIRDVAAIVYQPERFLVHTSGSVASDCLKFDGNSYGTLYPVQTFTKHIPVDFRTAPVCITASDENAEKKLQMLAQSLSEHVLVITDGQRIALHLCAVMVNNFTNHIFDIAAQLMNENELPFELLLPLITETVNKIKTTSPDQSQTGPAIRGDHQTLKKHMKMLEKYPEWQRLYTEISNSILQKFINS